jgi:hypothetical protein
MSKKINFEGISIYILTVEQHHDSVNKAFFIFLPYFSVELE